MPNRASQVLASFLRLGLTAFGGPVAHIGYFREEFVRRRAWLSERDFADLVALCQFLPGPASSQLGIAIGLSRAGLAGAVAAWLGFTLPSALLMILFALGLRQAGGELLPGALQGLKIVALAVVAQAVWGMARSLCPDAARRLLMLLAAGLALALPGTAGQLGVIAVSALAGRLLLTPEIAPHTPFPLPVQQRTGAACLALFTLLLVSLPLLTSVASDSQALAMADAFYRAGSLVFGGGHVVLPLLQAEVVPAGWASNDSFLAGYGAAQAVPGPLFTFAAFLGAAANGTPSGWLGGLLCLLAIFLPAFLLVIGSLPFWAALRAKPPLRAALLGINAGVVGLLLAALYDPVWTSTVRGPLDVALAALAFAALTAGRLPPWLVVVVGALGGAWRHAA
jgi:chromate transporter